jgi:hypothetical protein
MDKDDQSPLREVRDAAEKDAPMEARFAELLERFWSRPPSAGAESNSDVSEDPPRREHRGCPSNQRSH